jgi:L-alanine-DL-glutamate epimerase-like enolase superfamily enzyme
MIRSFSLPLARPLETAAGTIKQRDGFLFARDGGVGEAAPLVGWTESLDDCERALRAADDAPDWAGALDACEDCPAARHAVSLAELDADARANDESLASLLARRGAGFPDAPAGRVPVNATIGDADRDQTVAAARAAQADGFETVKVKVAARCVESDVERLAAVNDATDLEIRADANGAWTREQARDAVDALADLDVAYVEQPLPADDLAGHEALAGGPAPVALDESLATHDLDSVLAACDYVVLKPMALGGVDEALRAAERAREEGVEPVVTTTIDGVVARTAAVHLAACIPDVAACGLATADWLASDLAADPAPVESGGIDVPDASGHGVEVALDA